MTKIKMFILITAILAMASQSFSSQVIKINATQNAEKKFELIEPQSIPFPEQTVGLGDKNAKKRIENLASETQKMFEALYVDDLKTVREQLNKGVSANAKNDVGQTPLHVTQDLAILKLLISNGSDVNSVDGDGRTPIFNKEIEFMKILIEAGAGWKPEDTGKVIEREAASNAGYTVLSKTPLRGALYCL